MSIWEVMLLVAAVLAIIASALFIGVCLLIAWAKDAMSGHSQQDTYGGGGAPPMADVIADGRHRGASRPPVGSWRAGR